MTAPPMRRSQNLAALAAVMFAAAALLPLAVVVRLVCAGIAGIMIVTVLAMRLRAHRVRRDREAVDDVYRRIERIRTERARRRTR
jgi:hypothetical protein